MQEDPCHTAHGAWVWPALGCESVARCRWVGVTFAQSCLKRKVNYRQGREVEEKNTRRLARRATLIAQGSAKQWKLSQRVVRLPEVNPLAERKWLRVAVSKRVTGRPVLPTDFITRANGLRTRPRVPARSKGAVAAIQESCRVAGLPRRTSDARSL